MPYQTSSCILCLTAINSVCIFIHAPSHVYVLNCSVVSNSFVTPWTLAPQVPLSVGFLRQEYQNGEPFSPSGDLPNPRIEPASPVTPALVGGFFTIWEALLHLIFTSYYSLNYPRKYSPPHAVFGHPGHSCLVQSLFISGLVQHCPIAFSVMMEFFCICTIPICQLLTTCVY